VSYVIERVDGSPYAAQQVAAVYRAVGFRADLVDDVGSAARLGGATFVARSDADVVGVSSCILFGTSGWVGGVAVLPEARRSGIGRAMTQRAVDTLLEGGVPTVCLHATPMARPLYESMGFVADAELVELTGPALDEPDSEAGLRTGRPDDIAGVLALDHAVTGEDRSALLRQLWPQHGWVIGDEAIAGFCLRQLDSAAGAVISHDYRAGLVLLARAVSGRQGPLRVPTPQSRTDVISWLVERGYRQTSSTTRMQLGVPITRRDQGLVSAFNLYWG
jgi:GNAT superfamily N-acetyltransferase